MKGRRVSIRGPGDLTLEEFDVPTTVGHGEVLVSVHYSLISPGTELSGYRSANRKAAANPGYTAVGEVLDVGPGMDPDLKGQEVFLFPPMGDFGHCHATHKVMQAGGLAVPVPDDVDPPKACFARMVNIALTPYDNAAPKTAGAVFVIGLGLVGNMTAQVGRIRGFHTIAADPDPTRRRRAEQAGVDVVFDPEEKDPVEFVRSLTHGEGANLTVNAAGRGATFQMSLEASAPGGEVSTLGGARGEAPGDLTRIVGLIHTKHLTVRGGWEMRLPMRSAPASKVASTEMNVRNALRWLASGAVRLDPVWTHTIRPEQFKTAYDALSDHDKDYLGVIVDWT